MQKLLPPQLAALCLAVMLVSTSWIQQPLADGLIFRILGAAIGSLGLFLAVAAKRQFQRAKTNVNTFASPTVLITSGWFRFSRNPMYLGMLLLLTGIVFLLNNLLALIGPLLFLCAAAFWYIPYEEKEALAVFGEPYSEYCKTVRRWV